MKKFITMLLAGLALAAAPLTSSAQNPVASKDTKKEAKAAAKTLEKQGWTLEGSGTIEGAMTRHMAKIAEGWEELIGSDVTGSSSPRKALSICQTDAITEFMKMKGEAVLKGRVTSDIESLDGVDTDALVDMAEQNFMSLLKGELGMPTIKLEKGSAANKDYMKRCYWAISPNRAEQLAAQAAQAAINAQRNVENGAKHGEAVSDFINNGQKAE